MKDQTMEGLEGVVVRSGPTILTRGGSYFDLLDPHGSRIEIEDIAHALSNLCRFTGHTHMFYSVAEHSWWCSMIVSRSDALAALMHDAAEAFVGDVSRPLKSLIPDFRRIEHVVQSAICARFGLSLELPATVKEADLLMLASEQLHCMRSSDRWPGLDGVRPMVVPHCWSPEVAREKFLERFAELYVPEAA